MELSGERAKTAYKQKHEEERAAIAALELKRAEKEAAAVRRDAIKAALVEQCQNCDKTFPSGAAAAWQGQILSAHALSLTSTSSFLNFPL
jgi:hypothetical protein